MRIGLSAEIKNHEYRVGLTPASAREFIAHGHSVYVQSGAGLGIGVDDEEYRRSHVEILPDAASVFEAADMIVKVKEPQPHECTMLRTGQILFTYLHLAPDPAQTAALVESGAVCIAYEIITGPTGGLPLLAPMSEVAGRMSIQVAAVGAAQYWDRTRARCPERPHSCTRAGGHRSALIAFARGLAGNAGDHGPSSRCFARPQTHQCAYCELGLSHPRSIRRDPR
jgi:alanine dehydrogenase